MLFLLTDSLKKLKLEKIHRTLISLFYVSPSSPQLQRLFFFLLKTQKNNHSSASDWWEYTKSSFTENAKIFSKNSTTQENITISRQNLLLLLKTRKNNQSSASDWRRNTKSSFKKNVRTSSENSTTQENIKILGLKEDCKTYTKMKTSNQKLNQSLKTYKMNFIN